MRARVIAALTAAMPFALIFAVMPFGDPLAHWQSGDPTSALQTLALGGIWAFIMLLFGAGGEREKTGFYLILLCLVLYVERFNFREVTLLGAITWTNILCIALVTELFIVRQLGATGMLATSKLFSTAYRTLLFALPLTVLAYNHSFNAPLDGDGVVAIFQTDVTEAYDFVAEYIDPRYVLALVLLPALFLLFGWRQAPARPGFKFLLVVACVAALQLAVLYQTDYPKARLISLLAKSYTKYHFELTEFRKVRAERGAGIADLAAVKRGGKETFVVVIGESHSRNHMSAYGYVRETTPWLDRLAEEEGLLLFEHAYANHTHTVQALSLALTEANQYNGKAHYRSASLIDLARQAGFSTAWISNQVAFGIWDNVITALAETADRYVRLNKHVGRTVQTNVHDGEAVDALRQVAAALDEGGDNLIVVHLMGSHARYCERFPETFAVFNEADSFLFGRLAADVAFRERIDCYDNSVVYNDHVVGGLFEEARRIANLAGFFYFADHGEAVVSGQGHNSAVFSHEMTHTPMYVWLSDAYRSARPERVEELRRRRSAYFTNDLVYDTLVGLLGIETPFYDPRGDLGSKHFSLELSGARTLHGERPLHEDPFIAQRLFNDALPPGRVIAHRTNTLGKLADAAKAGFDGVEIDLVFQPGGAGGHFEPARDDRIRSHGTLDAFLDAAQSWGLTKLWLDIKNLDDENYEHALAELERLASEHAELKRIAIIESFADQAWFAQFAASGWHTSYYLPTEPLLEAMRATDRTASERAAEAIARQVKAQKTAAVSFDTRLYPFVKKHLEPLLGAEVVYHAYDLEVRAWEPEARRTLEAKPYFDDPRLQTILVRISSEFHL
jgi:heptose-I-phosphate ethanolaminephosphotransferase